MAATLAATCILNLHRAPAVDSGEWIRIEP